MTVRLSRSGAWWKADFEFQGKRVVRQLPVPVEGKPGKALGSSGDAAFEQSRLRAQAAEHELKRRLRAGEIDLEQTRNHVRQAAKVKVAELADFWERFCRKRKNGSAKYVEECRAKIDRFANFIQTAEAVVEDPRRITSDMAARYMETLWDDGVTGATYNRHLTLLKTLFACLVTEGHLERSPFARVPKAENETVHRVPFTRDQAMRLLEASKTHPVEGSAVIIALTTGLRRHDVCNLRWEAVDLDNGRISLITEKTNSKVSIPILPALAELLGKLPQDTEFVCPELATRFRQSPDAVTNRVIRLINDTLNGDGEVERSSFGRKKRARGLRRANLYGLHSLRTTFVTLGLSAGIPIETLSKITGHSLAQTVRKHYYHPSDEEVLQVVGDAMSVALSNREEPNWTPKAEETLQRAAELLEALDDADAQDAAKSIRVVIARWVAS